MRQKALTGQVSHIKTLSKIFLIYHIVVWFNKKFRNNCFKCCFPEHIWKTFNVKVLLEIFAKYFAKNFVKVLFQKVKKCILNENLYFEGCINLKHNKSFFKGLDINRVLPNLHSFYRTLQCYKWLRPRYQTNSPDISLFLNDRDPPFLGVHQLSTESCKKSHYHFCFLNIIIGSIQKKRKKILKLNVWKHVQKAFIM